LFAAAVAILGAIVTSHTHRNVTNQPKKRQIINCGVTILIVSVFLVPLTNYHTAGAVDKMAGTFTQRI